MPPAVCILCNTNDHAKTLYPATVTEEDLNPTVFSARRMPDRVHGEILRCGQCGLVYPRQLLNTEKLGELYERSKFTYDDQEPYIRKTYERYVRRATQALHNPHLWSFLDIGCGNGFMLSVAKEIGFDDINGVEPGTHAIDSAKPDIKSHIKQGFFSKDTFGDKRFDLITCFQTLDHIPDPVGFVHDCFATLKPGGVALFINHNIASLFARLLGERCPMIDIEHTYLHTPSTMRSLFAKAGFSNIETFSVRNDYPLAYWLHMTPGPKRVKQWLIGASKNIGIGNMVIPLHAGNVGLIGKR